MFNVLNSVVYSPLLLSPSLPCVHTPPFALAFLKKNTTQSPIRPLYGHAASAPPSTGRVL